MPRYYLNWLKKNQNDDWKKYVTEKKHENYLKLKEINENNLKEYLIAKSKNFHTKSINQQRALAQKLNQSRIKRKI